MPWERFIFASDFHACDHNQAVIDRIVAEIKAFEPKHVICGGDLFEAVAATRWPTEKIDKLQDEYRAGNDILRAMREAAPDGAKLIWTLGNHDDNLQVPCRIDPKIRSMLHWNYNPTEFPEFRNWRQLPYETNKNRCAYRIGQALFMHGFEASDTGLNKQMYEYCDPWGLICTGHTHRPTDLIQASVNRTALPYWRITAGCAQDFRDSDKVHYMRRKTRVNWGHGIVRGEALAVKSPRAGRYWDAEPVIFSVGSDDADTGRWEPKRAIEC